MNAVTDGDFESVVLAGERSWWTSGPPGADRAGSRPVLEALEAKLVGRVTVVKLNVDENPETASRYDVSGLPTVILFTDGEPVRRVDGLKPKGALRAALEPWIS
jgi:thioredoxin-like negative regulator of GroEL